MGVFLSYARDDADRVAALRTELEELRPPLWLDSRLHGGQEWWSEILRQLRSCDLVVLAMTNSSVRSTACLAEVRYALALGRPFLGVLLEDVDLTGLDEAIRRRQLVSFHTADVASVRALALAALTMGAPPPLPDPLPPEPPPPAAYEDRFAEVLAPRLDLDQQIALFARLRFDIENGVQVARATALLDKLYERADLSWLVRRDIGEFRAAPDTLSVEPSVEPSSVELPSVEPSPVPDESEGMTYPAPACRTSRLVKATAHNRIVEIFTAYGSFTLSYTYRYYSSGKVVDIDITVDGVPAYKDKWLEKIPFTCVVGGRQVQVMVRSRNKVTLLKNPIVSFVVTVNGQVFYSEG